MKFLNRSPIVLLITLLAISLLAGCSGLRHYKDRYDKNLVVRTKTDSGSFFSSVKTAIDIHSVDGKCQTNYQGTVDLKKSQISIGIPPGQTSYLVFVFSSSSFLASTKGSTTFETLLKPRTGYAYDINVSYLEDIYNVEIFEKSMGKETKREILPVDLNACKTLR